MVVVFVPDDPSYSPGEGEEGVILYAPFIRGGGDTGKQDSKHRNTRQGNKMSPNQLIENKGMYSRQGI